MGMIRKLGSRGAEAARRAAGTVKTRILVGEGRRSIRRKMNAVGTVTRKAARAGVIVGTAAAASVVTREIRKRRRLAGGKA